MHGNLGWDAQDGSAMPKSDGLLTRWYGIVAILLSITLSTAGYIWALAESATRAYHSNGDVARRSHLLHSEYVLCSALFAVVSALLIYGRKKSSWGGRSADLVALSMVLVFVGFVSEMFVLTLVGAILHRLRW